MSRRIPAPTPLPAWLRDERARAKFMRVALAQAEKGRGRTHPNPAVGAVVVKSGKVVGRGYHRKAGEAHAEVEALRDAGARAKGAALFVTLEPCAHYGRTPPCADAVLAAGIAQVFVGIIDPNPKVHGRGVARLKRAGLFVETNVLGAACEASHRPFIKHMRTGRPWVVLKAAATADGKIATAGGDSRWVSGEAARRLTHRWRDELDAVLAGAGTIDQDDPLLTTRLDRPAVPGRKPRTPLRVVVDGRGRPRAQARVFDVSAGPVLLLTAQGEDERLAAIRARGVEVARVAGTPGRVAPGAVLDELGRRSLTSVLVEGGAGLHGAFLREGLADEVRLFIAPKVIGAEGLSWAGALGIDKMADALRLEDVQVRQVGADVLLVGRPAKR